jgi:glucokinase-like ROK family protein
MVYTPATAALMRSINRAAVLQLIRDESPMTRAQIARRLQLSLPTVIRIVDEFKEEDLVRETGDVTVTGGRPGSLLEFNGGAYFVVGVDLGGTKMLGTVTDLTGNIKHEQYVVHRPDSTPEALESELIRFVESLVGVARKAGKQVRGIGVGVPGMVTTPEGIVQWAPSLGWRNIPLQARLADHVGLPVFVENDLNLAALGELGFGAGRGARHLVMVSVGTGIGAGIVIDGALYRGAHQIAGEIGYMPPGTAYLGRRYDGFGALEALAAGPGIAERARTRIAAGGLPLDAASLTTQDVFAAAREGEIWACHIVADTVDLLALALANICTLLDPEVIVLGGGVARSSDLLIEPIRARLEGVVPLLPRIEASMLESRASSLGAVMLVLNGTDGVSHKDAKKVQRIRRGV